MKSTKEYPIIVCDLCNTETEFEGMVFMASCVECGKDLCLSCAISLSRGRNAVYCCPDHLSDKVNEALIIDDS